jgi:hypothetical protein
MDIFKELEKLCLPLDKYIVVGSGIMSAKGIRPTNDIDTVTTPEIFESYKQKEGWELLEWTKPGIVGKEWLRNGAVELYQQLSRKDGSLSLADLVQDSEVINGVSFLSLGRLIEFKEEYGRPKDFDDIRLIRDYINRA